MLTVNGEAIDDAVVREEAANLRPKYYEVMTGGDPIELEMQLREWSRENVIERTLLQQEAARRSVELPQLIDQVHAAVPQPKPKEVGDFYAKNKQKFWVPELFHCAHVVRNVDETHSEADAQAAIQIAEAELARGVAFAVVADQHSDCPGQGGDLGWCPRGQMVPEFEAVVFSLKTGQTSPIFRTPFGFHIARMIGHKPEGIPALADVREHLAAQLLQEKQQHAVDAFVDELRARATVAM